MKFGLYYATSTADVFVQNCSDLIRRYDPDYLYFDGPQGLPGATTM